MIGPCFNPFVSKDASHSITTFCSQFLNFSTCERSLPSLKTPVCGHKPRKNATQTEVLDMTQDPKPMGRTHGSGRRPLGPTPMRLAVWQSMPVPSGFQQNSPTSALGFCHLCQGPAPFNTSRRRSAESGGETFCLEQVDLTMFFGPAT